MDEKTAPAQPAPIDMVLYCPECGLQHIDKPEDCPDFPGCCECRGPHWKNQPHRSHLCHGCGWIWRPSDVPTNGVAAIKTKGKTDSPVPAQPAPQSEPVAEVMSGWVLAWAGSEPIAHLLARHPTVRIGSKLYTAPPAPQPLALSDEQIGRIAAKTYGMRDWNRMDITFARAILAAAQAERNKT